jgi:hypothetical protein
MKRSNTVTGCRRFIRIVADALTGRLGITAMVMGYSICAFVLLAYVSTKVYTYSLMEDISARERQQRLLTEKVGLLTKRYAELSAMDRITGICESKLGMLPAETGRMLRVSIDTGWSPEGAGSEFEDGVADLPGMVDRRIDEITEVIRR